jgi:acetyltransferase-like isoleucine patch superfamily enzyme
MISKLFIREMKILAGFIYSIYFFIFKNCGFKTNVPLKNAEYGRNIFIDSGVTLKHFNKKQKLRVEDDSRIMRESVVVTNKIGRFSYIGKNCDIYCSKIGSFCSIANNVAINNPVHPVDFVSSHRLFFHPYRKFVKKLKTPVLDTEIGNDVWIGRNSYIKGGVKIGNGAVIGACSVVTKDVPNYSIFAGNPAKLIRYRFDKKTRERLEDSGWWRWKFEKLRKYRELFSNTEKFLEKYENEKKDMHNNNSS